MASKQLPEELLELILGHLDVVKDKTTISSLRLTNKTIHRLATPLLGRTVSTKALRSSDARSVETEVESVAQDILKLPDLAYFVHALHVQSRIVGFGGLRRLSVAKDRLTRRLIPDILFQDVCSGVASGNGDDCIAYVLATCSRLQRLEFGVTFREIGENIVRVFKAAAKNQFERIPSDQHGSSQLRPLGYVREVKFDRTYRGVSLADALVVLSLPHLHYLHIFQLTDDKSFMQPVMPESTDFIRNSNPLRLTFDNCRLSGESLGTLLSVCSRPQSLIARWRVGPDTDHVTDDTIGDALRQHGKQLKYIHLNTADMRVHRDATYPAAGLYGDLSNLQAETLVLSALAIGDKSRWNVRLPAHLRRLYILGAEDGGERDSKAMKLPNLEEIVYVPWYRVKIRDRSGRVWDKCVDYDIVGGFEFRNGKTREEDVDNDSGSSSDDESEEGIVLGITEEVVSSSEDGDESMSEEESDRASADEAELALGEDDQIAEDSGEASDQVSEDSEDSIDQMSEGSEDDSDGMSEQDDDYDDESD